METKTALNTRLLAIIGRRHQEIFDIIPRGPQDRIGPVALNPQPLPPRELGAAIAAEFLHAAWFADRFGRDLEPVIADLDDWCPTKPIRLKLPPWWPPMPDPEPEPNWFVDLHLGFVSRLAYGAFESGRMKATFDRIIERSVAAIESATVNS